MELLKSEDGDIRKALVRNPTRQIVEKSVKQLVPLEISCADPDVSCEYREKLKEKDAEGRGPTLRERKKPVNYAEDKMRAPKVARAVDKPRNSSTSKDKNRERRVTFEEQPPELPIHEERSNRRKRGAVQKE